MTSSALLAGRVALITGGGSGIGRAVSELFAKAGAHVVSADINHKAASETVQKLGDGNHSAIELDVNDADSIVNSLNSIMQKYTQAPNVVVNCAGITSDSLLDMLKTSEFDRVLDINLKGTYLVTQTMSVGMVKSNIRNGSIINIGSIVGKVGNMGQSNYAASKAGVVGFTKSIAKELAKFNIRCNAVLPGFINTPMVKSIPEKVIEKLMPLIPLGRMGSPAEVAEVCLFLASDESSFVTGAEIEVTGGAFM